MTPLNPTDRLTVTLEAQQWNQVLAFVGEGPYRIAAPLIQALQEQLNSAPSSRDPDNVVSMEAS